MQPQILLHAMQPQGPIMITCNPKYGFICNPKYYCMQCNPKAQLWLHAIPNMVLHATPNNQTLSHATPNMVLHATPNIVTCNPKYCYMQPQILLHLDPNN